VAELGLKSIHPTKPAINKLHSNKVLFLSHILYQLAACELEFKGILDLNGVCCKLSR
jgi:hypothetical protein